MHRFPEPGDVITYPGENEFIVVPSPYASMQLAPNCVLVVDRDGSYEIEKVIFRYIPTDWEQAKIVFIKKVSVKFTKNTMTYTVKGDN